MLARGPAPRATGAVIGRSAELEAISQELQEASGRLAAVTLEGEPGIGKTRLLLAAAELASAAGFTCVAITADEEIRGPFLVARSLFASDAIRETAAGTPAEAAVRRVVEAISGRDEPGFESLSPDAKLLRAFDLAGVAISALVEDPAARAAHRRRPVGRRRHAPAPPVRRPERRRPADLPVPDDPTGRVRHGHRGGQLRRRHGTDGPRPTDATWPIRSARDCRAPEARPRRSGRSLVCGGDACPVRGRSVHRRGARPDPPRGGNAPAGGRRVAPRPQRGAARPLGGPDPHRPSCRATPGPDQGCPRRRGDPRPQLQPARPSRDPGAASATATSPRMWPRATVRRTRPMAPTRSPTTSSPRSRPACCSRSPTAAPPTTRSPTSRSANSPRTCSRRLAAGRSMPRWSTCCSRAATRLRPGCRCSPSTRSRPATPCAPRGSRSRPRRRLSARTPPKRRSASSSRHSRWSRRRPSGGPSSSRAMTRTPPCARPANGSTASTELAALAEAMRDPAIELDVQLRRASALRMSHDEDAAAELARRVRTRARERGDAATELRANLELGQALLRAPLGESFGGAAPEIDLDGAEEAYRRAIELAEQLHDDRSLAAALREIGMIDFARGRAWFAGEVFAGRASEVLAAVAAGADIETLLLAVADRPAADRCRAGPRAGARHLRTPGRPDGRHVDGHRDGLRQLRAGHAPVLVGAPPRGDPARDEPLVRGRHRERARPPRPPDAVRRPRLLAGQGRAGPGAVPRRGRPPGGEAPGRPGDRVPRRRRRRALPARARRVAGAERWLGHASTAASVAQTRSRSIQLETWRGMVRAGAGDAEGMREHLEQAVTMATESGRASARCEALARLALEASRLVTPASAARLAPSSSSSSDRRHRSRSCCRSCRATLRGARRRTPRCPRSRSPAATSQPRDGRRRGARGTAGRRSTRTSASRSSFPAARAVLAGGPPEAQRPGAGLPPGDAVADGPGHRRREDPRRLADRPGRTRARRARRTDGPDRRADRPSPDPRPSIRRGVDEHRAPAAAAADRGPDQRRDRGRARLHRGTRSPAA